MRIAIIENNFVVNVVEGNELLELNWVEDTTGEAGIGDEWNGTTFIKPIPSSPIVRPKPQWSDPNLDKMYWWVDVGPFLDRFGAKALAITSSTDPLTVQGLITILLPRKYIDLKRADLPQMLDILIAKGLIDSTDKTNILTTPTTDYERYQKGMEQPE